VKGVVVRLDELVQQIQKEYTHQQHVKFDELLSIKIYDEKQQSSLEQFRQSQLVIDCLIRMKPSSFDKTEFIAFCKHYYRNNNSQLMVIKEFEQDYSPERALWWYTRHSFLSRLLTKAFRDENIDLLFRFRFFIHHMGCQLGKNRCSSSVRVYRGQLMSKEEFIIFKKSTGKFISINSFLSASLSQESTRSLLDSAAASNETEKVFFQIDADPHLHNIKPFANIQSHSFFPKAKEVLFMVGSIFRIDHIECSNDNIWNVRIVLSSTDEQQIKSLFVQMKNELGTGETSPLRFGHILRQMGKLNNSEKYFRRYVNQLPNTHPDIGNGYNALGMIAESKKDFGSSIKWYKKSLAVHTPDDQNVADTYNHIANVYSNAGDYTNAIKSYEKALEIWMKTSSEKHQQVIKCLNDMGVVYEIQKKYTEAFDCYQKALDISKNTISSKDPIVALTYRNIASVHEAKGEYSQALSAYEKAVKIYRDSLPSSQVYVNEIEKSIQRVSKLK
jgi:hypothetical protein